jgi:intracellular sulfur oxidation DsrE/DsrF family protein
MHDRPMRLTTAFLVLVALMLLPLANASSQEPRYAAMEGVASVRTAFDFRVDDPDVALAHLKLIHSMLDAPSMQGDDIRPEIVVVFVGPSVKLVAIDGTAIAEQIAAMHADGVRLEVCMTAAQAHGVAAESILPEMVQVGNGWISLIGYQHQGYALIADF